MSIFKFAIVSLHGSRRSLELPLAATLPKSVYIAGRVAEGINTYGF